MLRLAESIPEEKVSETYQHASLQRLAVTDKYLLSWRLVDPEKASALFYLWNTEGRYLGKVPADQILGSLWQPREVTVWENNTLIIAACKLTGQEQVELGTGAKVRKVDRQIWTWHLFFVQLN